MGDNPASSLSSGPIYFWNVAFLAKGQPAPSHSAFFLKVLVVPIHFEGIIQNRVLKYSVYFPF